MNTKDNARKRETRRRIREALAAELGLQGSLDRVTVTALCQRAGINRSTFYASYHDVFDLAEQTCAEISQGMSGLFRGDEASGPNHLEILRHIYDNQEAFRLGFKLGIGDGPILRWDIYEEASRPADAAHEPMAIERHHAEFFRAGFNAIVRMWLEAGCQETPEEIYEVILGMVR